MKPPFRSVLCPTDFSALGNLAVEIAYLVTAPGGTVHLLHVDEPPKTGNPLYPDEAPKGAPTPAQIEAAKARRRDRLQALVPADASARGIRTEVDLAYGEDVAVVIEAEHRRRKTEVIVLSSHGRWGVARILQGQPTAIRMLHESDLDVIVVHTDKP